MFQSGKVYPQQKKARKRHGPAFYIIGLFTFAIEAMLGINAAFLIDQSITIVARNMLDGTFLAPLASVITLIVSLTVGFCFIMGGMWTFSGFMDSLDDARAYRKEYATGNWPVTMVWALEGAVIALDCTTLAFRAAYFAEKGAIALLAFFVILIFMPPVLGPLIHVLENTPRDRRLAKAKHVASALETNDVMDAVEMMDADVRTMWLNGRTEEALKEHYRRMDARQQELLQIQDAEQMRQQEGQRRKNSPPSIQDTSPLATASLPQQAENGSH